MNPVRLAIVGCSGRMGRALLRLASADPAFQITAAVTVAEDPALGRDAGLAAGVGEFGVPISEACAAACDVAIEFTLPAGCRAWAAWCADHGVALVSGTTGLSDADAAALHAAAARVPVVWSPNMSIGINLLLQLVTEAARRLDPTWDVEICETHHKEKIDAPSGTARALFEAVCAARGQDPLDAATYCRYGQCGPRQPGEIGVHALRLGTNIGEHEVYFAGAGETLTLRHQAQSRDIFALGALRAARWVVGRPPGLYHMRDVLADSGAGH
jgi:4-hydroxy-tetrahydrodipicolinate reductase